MKSLCRHIVLFLCLFVITASLFAQAGDSLSTNDILEGIETADIEQIEEWRQGLTNGVLDRIERDELLRAVIDQEERLERETDDTLKRLLYEVLLKCYWNEGMNGRKINAGMKLLQAPINNGTDSLFASWSIWDGYARIGDAKNALFWFEFYGEVKHRLGIYAPWEGPDSDLPQLYDLLGHYDQYLFHARREAFNWIKHSPYPVSYISAMNNVGVAFRKAGQLDSAIYYHQLSYDSIQGYLKDSIGALDLGMAEFQYFVLGNIGDCYILKKQYEKAIPLLLLDLRKSQSQYHPRDKASVMNNLAKAHLGLGETAAAKVYLDSCILLYKHMQDDRGMSELSSLLAEYHYQKRNIDQYHYYITAYHSYKDSVEQSYKNTNLSALLTTIDADRLRRTIEEQQDSLTQERRISEEKEIEATANRKTRNFLLVLLAIFIIIGAVAAYLVWKLRKQEDIIRSNLSEKEALLQEIHHRVKNNLQLVNGLLDMQSDKITDESLKQAFVDTQLRVRSMANLHQKLYSSGNFQLVSMQEYVEDIMSSIAISYGQDQRIKTTLDCNDLQFSLETCVPIGLIINELVTNAYKYAFPNLREGNIIVNISPTKDKSYLLVVQDDGVGFELPEQKEDSIGLDLVRGLAKQLHGELTFKANNGSHFEVTFIEKAR